ncbi:MAG: hypothetical protein M3N53_11070 [Actinomycetota bacterium]|nr:hypothetical protein [Actinomycetota bacterium]
MARHLQRTIRRLEDTFDASVAREEEAAANDLAVSLLQDRTVQIAVTRAGDAVVTPPGGASARLSVVGSDYCGSGAPLDAVWRLDRVTVWLQAAGSPPDLDRRSFVEVLRIWAREVRQVEVVADACSFRGRLIRTGRDHVVVAQRNGRRVIPLRLVVGVTLVPGG